MSDEVREQARAWAEELTALMYPCPTTVAPGPILIDLIAVKVEPLLAAKAEAEHTQEQRCVSHAAFMAEGDCVFCDKEQADESATEAWQVADALAGALKKAQEWAASYPLQGVGSHADAVAADDVYTNAGAALALHSEAKKR